MDCAVLVGERGDLLLAVISVGHLVAAVDRVGIDLISLERARRDVGIGDRSAADESRRLIAGGRIDGGDARDGPVGRVCPAGRAVLQMKERY